MTGEVEDGRQHQLRHEKKNSETYFQVEDFFLRFCVQGEVYSLSIAAAWLSSRLRSELMEKGIGESLEIPCLWQTVQSFHGSVTSHVSCAFD